MQRYARIACLSTSRADAGIYRPLLSALLADPRFDPTLIASHSCTKADLPPVPILTTPIGQLGDYPVAVARATGDAVGKFAEALMQIRPDLVFVLGDRTEMLAAALAATICTLPIAHLHGGDTTRGAYDDACRHAISKLAHIHFPALTEHGRVLQALGESPDCIHVVGALALDELARFDAEAIEVCSAAVSLDLRKPTLLVVFHPETISNVPVCAQIEPLVRAIAATRMQVLWIDPNADVGHGEVNRAISALAETRGEIVRLNSVSQNRFWSCLVHCRALIGNSSAGIIEAASLRRPVVNIGCRQEGRVRAGNVLDVGYNADDIAQAVVRATSDEFRASLEGVINPYGDGRAAGRILEALANLPDRLTLLRKPDATRQLMNRPAPQTECSSTGEACS